MQYNDFIMVLNKLLYLLVRTLNCENPPSVLIDRCRMGDQLGFLTTNPAPQINVF